MVKTLPFNTGDGDSIPAQEIKIPHASQLKNQSINQKLCCNKFKTDFKNDSFKKNELKKRMKSHPLKKCLLNAYYVLGARDTVVSHTQSVPLWSLHSGSEWG